MRTRPLARAVAFSAAIALLSAASPAAADDQAVATELFNAGRDLMRQGDFAAACPKLAESVRLEPTVGALAKLAFCEEHERRLVSARARWEQALNLARSAHDAREGEAAREFARVDASVPKLLLHARVAPPPSATIQVDDLRLGLASLGVPLAVAPGPHAIEVSAPGKMSWSTTAEGGSKGGTIAIEIPPLEDAPAPPSVDIAPPMPAPPLSSAERAHAAAAPRPLGPWREAGLGVAAAGGVVLGIGAVLGIVAIEQKFGAQCAGTSCPSDASARQLEGAQSSANRSTEAFVVGGILAAGGLSLWLLGPRASEPSAPQIEARAGVGALSVRGRF
jgi:hypothetical protein